MCEYNFSISNKRGAKRMCEYENLYEREFNSLYYLYFICIYWKTKNKNILQFILLIFPLKNKWERIN